MAPRRAAPKLAAYLAPFAPLSPRARAGRAWSVHVTGLLTDLPRKNGDTIAAAVAGTSTERRSTSDRRATGRPRRWTRRGCASRLVALSPPGGVLVLDDTGLPKKGTASVGVAPQYTGTWARVANCQVVVSAEYVEDAPETSAPLHWPVSARLFLPKTGPRTRPPPAGACAPGGGAPDQAGTRPGVGRSGPGLGRPLRLRRGRCGLRPGAGLPGGTGGARGALTPAGSSARSACVCPTRSPRPPRRPRRLTGGADAPPCPDRRPCGTPRPCWGVCRRRPGSPSPGARAPRAP